MTKTQVIDAIMEDIYDNPMNWLELMQDCTVIYLQTKTKDELMVEFQIEEEDK